MEIRPGIADRAMFLAQRYGLRGYDAIHLAAALELQTIRKEMQLPALIFVSADQDQLQVAIAEGLPAENPNQYP